MEEVMTVVAACYGYGDGNGYGYGTSQKTRRK